MTADFQYQGYPPNDPARMDGAVLVSGAHSEISILGS
jgi:hypothetical protein